MVCEKENTVQRKRTHQPKWQGQVENHTRELIPRTHTQTRIHWLKVELNLAEENRIEWHSIGLLSTSSVLVTY